MNGKDLFEAMDWVDERFVEEAEKQTLSNGTVLPWIRAASVAACLCVLLFSLHMAFRPAEQVAEASTPDSTLATGATQQPTMASPDVEIADECPSVMLHVDEMTSFGFVGTVVQLVDTPIFQIGMKLNVVFPESALYHTDYSGWNVIVDFTEYDEETGTIIGGIVTIVEWCNIEWNQTLFAIQIQLPIGFIETVSKETEPIDTNQIAVDIGTNITEELIEMGNYPHTPLGEQKAVPTPE